MKTLLFSLLNLLFTSGLFSQDVKVIEQKTYDLIYVPSEDMIYVSIPADEINGNSVCAIDPYFAVIDNCYFIGDGPNRLALSNDGSILYISLTQIPEIKKFNLQTKSIEGTIHLGQSETGHDLYADAIVVLPNDSNTLAVSRFYKDPIHRFEGIAVFDSDTMRALTIQNDHAISIDKFTSNGRLYSFNNENTGTGIKEVIINNEGATNSAITKGLIASHLSEIKIQENFMYSSFGERISLVNSSPQLVGRYSVNTTSRAAVIPAPDSNVVYFIKEDGGTNFDLLTFQKSSYNKIDSVNLPFSYGHLVNSIFWGGDSKIAFNTLESITIIRNCNSLISDSLILSPDLLEGCWGDTISITAPDGFDNYNWSNGVHSKTISTPNPGEFYFYSIDSLGCKSAFSNKVKVRFDDRPEPPDIWDFEEIQLCKGHSRLLIASSPTSWLLWSNGETSHQIDVNTTGDYSVVSFSNVGCMSEPSNIISITMLNDTVPDRPVIEVFGSTVICEGGSITLGAPPHYDIYQWSDLESTQLREVFYPNLYTVRVGNHLHCLSESSYYVRVDSKPRPATPIINSNGNLLASSSDTGNQWFLNGNLINGAIHQIYTPVESGFYSVQVTIDDCVSEISLNYNHLIVNTQDYNVSEQIKIYPNPSTGQINLLFGDDSAYLFDSVEVFDFTGISVLKEIDINQISLNEFPNGLYIIKLSNRSGSLIAVKTITKME